MFIRALPGWRRGRMGYNGNANLGTGNRTFSYVPTGVFQAGVLAGKSVVAIDAGSNHTLALCANGSLVAWGLNADGELGNNGKSGNDAPVLTDRSACLPARPLLPSARDPSTALHSVRMEPWPVGDITSTASGQQQHDQQQRAGGCDPKRSFIRKKRSRPSPPGLSSIWSCARMAPWPHGEAIPLANWATAARPTAACRCW